LDTILFTNVHKENNPKDAAIQALQSRLTEIDAAIDKMNSEAEELRGLVAAIKGEIQVNTITRYQHVKPGQYAGMDRKPALIAYLNERGGTASIVRASYDLEIGGVKGSKDQAANLRHLRQTISNNSHPASQDPTFIYNKPDDIVTLIKKNSKDFKKK
jgi:hypothetical protein